MGITLLIIGVVIGGLLLVSLMTVLNNRFIDTDGRLKTRTVSGRVIDIDSRPKKF